MYPHKIKKTLQGKNRTKAKDTWQRFVLFGI